MSDNPPKLYIQGASQNNLKNIDLQIPLNELTVVTGVSGSGKSSLAFDTIYAEGQRRYVETFSAYARQFLDRMDRPKVKRIDGVPPAVAIDQVNPVRTTRSTVGTMTELNDLLKLLFARFGSLYCSQCGDLVSQHNSDEICDAVLVAFARSRKESFLIQIAFSIMLPDGVEAEFVTEHLQRQGYKNVYDSSNGYFTVVQDRLRPVQSNRSRLTEAIEIALKNGSGTVLVQQLGDSRQPTGEQFRFSDRLQCDRCEVSYSPVIPNSFSFNSAVGACDTCRGFGRIMGIDYDLVIPDDRLTLEHGAVKPLTSKTYRNDMRDMLEVARERGIRTDVAWRNLTEEDRNWVVAGDENYRWRRGRSGPKQWYGMKRFFDWEERRSYKMHMRIFLSNYRGYSLCPSCGGSRLKPEALRWRIGEYSHEKYKTFCYPSFNIPHEVYRNLPGLTIHDLAQLPLSELTGFFENLALKTEGNPAASLLLDEVRTRIEYLNEVGLGYLNLDRQSRTLSGGEVQRINLTTALGTTLVNTLFVLDEPTIGLHTRDVGRVTRILNRLRDAGNSLLIVEHDEQVIRSADRILDIGPGPGERGGNVVHFGSYANLLKKDNSVTGQCLRELNYIPKLDQLPVSDATPRLKFSAIRHHNLKNIDLSLPLQRLACVTGVSGSGKSSLVNEVVFRGVMRHLGRPTQPPGDHLSFTSDFPIIDAVMVDQSPIGKSARSNPVTYVGALTRIRERLAAEPLARQRGYKPGYFSFNSSLGRCPECEGTGFEHVEMQFLSDVYLRCAKCNGTRFRPEIHDIKTAPSQDCDSEPKSIVDVLEMTVSEAVEFFHDDTRIVKAFKPLQDVGLDYLKLGQPVPTLSGGEAQRLKLAMHIGKSRKHNSDKNPGMVVYFFDEPTTGLHFTDVAKLISALRKLIEVGHSVIVIEHNLDLINCADWVVDLGPEGGESGGQIVAQGTPQQLAANQNSHTGLALRQHQESRLRQCHEKKILTFEKAPRNSQITVTNAREHNLKNLNVSIPYQQFTVITGMSGSGKSTLAFDILFKEGQRRYLETLNAYSRQFVQPASRADFDAVTGLPPTVAIEQRMSRGGTKSTVATLTEVYHYIRLLFTRFGVQYCPDCQVEVDTRSVDELIDRIWDRHAGRKILVLSTLVSARKGIHTDIAKWAAKRGVNHLLVDGQWIPTDDWPVLSRYQEHDIVMPLESIKLDRNKFSQLHDVIHKAAKLTGGFFQITELQVGDDFSHAIVEDYSIKRECPQCHRGFQELDPRQFSFNSAIGWCMNCKGVGLESAEESNSEDDQYNPQEQSSTVCGICKGNRLNPSSLAVRFKAMTIDAVVSMSIAQAYDFFQQIDLSKREREAMGDIFSEMCSRLEFLISVGLSYLSLDRAAPTLSGGEAQRIRLASQLGSGLSGACYIMDEPTIGLHPADNRRLLNALHSLKAKGNTIVVVEHDEETITNADYIIDLGPGGGEKGGQVVAYGTVGDIRDNADSVTGQCLSNPLQHPLPRNRPPPDPERMLRISGAKANNLKSIDVSIPAGQLICITGVSGSGKSTLITDVIYKNMRTVLARKRHDDPDPHHFSHCNSIEGWNLFRSVLKVDQTPIGRTPRSCPATYIKIWDTIRKLFTQIPESKIRGYDQGRFSFNLSAGQCTQCKGQGEKKIEMSFLPNVRVQCEACEGNRFNSETLSVKFQDKSIADVLNMSVDEAIEFFAFQPSLKRIFQLLIDVGLGYLRLGQPSPSLSGGEAQRIKLVSELSKATNTAALRQTRSGHPSHNNASVLYVLDEPTVGLHTADVEKLLRVIHQLVDAGNTVVVVEHNLDFVAEADWIIDLGPHGGSSGGEVVVQGSITGLLKSQKSLTAEFLESHHSRRSSNAASSKFH